VSGTAPASGASIAAAGCVFASGPGLALARIALVTGTSLHRRHPFFVDRCGEAVPVSYFPRQPGTDELQPWVVLARSALLDLQAQLPPPAAAACPGGRLMLVLPPAGRPGVPGQLAERLCDALRHRGLAFESVEVLEGGHAAAVFAVERAARSLGTAGVTVLAVDSWLHAKALRWLESQDLLHGAGKPYGGAVHRNPYGRIPGEAAAAVLLSQQPGGWCRLVGLGLADEPVLRTDARPCTGQGWTQAAQQALQHLPAGRSVARVFCDLNGEPYRADSFGFTCLRVADRLAPGWQPVTPALVSGDVGCATSLLQMALSAGSLRRADTEPPIPEAHLLLASSDDRLRSAVVLER